MYRKLMSRMFTARRVAELEPFIRKVAAQHLDAVRDQDRFDMVQDFSLWLPLEVIGELVGAPARAARARPTSSRIVRCNALRTQRTRDVMTALIEMFWPLPPIGG